MAPFAGTQWIKVTYCLALSAAALSLVCPIEMGLTLLIHFKLALGLVGFSCNGFVVIGMFTAVPSVLCIMALNQMNCYP